MSNVGSSSNQMTSCDVPWKLSWPWSKLLSWRTLRPPSLRITWIPWTASGTFRCCVIRPSARLGMRPVPNAPTGPNSSCCRMLRVVSACHQRPMRGLGDRTGSLARTVRIHQEDGRPAHSRRRRSSRIDFLIATAAHDGVGRRRKIQNASNTPAMTAAPFPGGGR